MFEARDGKKFLVVFEEEVVDLVILDIMLPELDAGGPFAEESVKHLRFLSLC